MDYATHIAPERNKIRCFHVRSVKMRKPLCFLGKYGYPFFMKQNLFYLSLPLFLTGCIGSLIMDQTEYSDECYPDIRTVPERTEALCPRGLHKGEENVSRAAEFERLSQDWEKITARDKALREKVFPPQS